MAKAHITERTSSRLGKPQSEEEAYHRLGRAQQWQLLRELVETRGEELRRAYRGVVRIGIGYRRRRNRRDPRQLVTSESPCVLFMVRRKWPKPRGRRADTREGAIPRTLSAFATTSRGRRVKVAIPTDVDSAVWLRKCRPHASISARVDGSAYAGNGQCCAVLSVRGGGPVRYGLSCRHVLSFSARSAVSTDYVVSGGRRVGIVTAIRGANGGDNVMDAQLFQIGPGAVAWPSHQGFVTAVEEIDGPLVIQAASAGDGGIDGELRGFWQSDTTTTASAKHWMLAGELLEIGNLSGSTARGDSGARVNDAASGSTLVGMHIGAAFDEQGVQVASVCIPAWRLLDAALYEGIAANARFSLR